MKILQHAKQKDYMSFTCEKCGCVFQCEKDEYWEKKDAVGYSLKHYQVSKIYMTCCPECHKIVERHEYAEPLKVQYTDALQNTVSTEYKIEIGDEKCQKI